MSLTGILLDVSLSMQDNIGSGTDEEGGPWAQSIFNIIDDLIEHDLSDEHRVFAIGVGADCVDKEIFDVLGTLQQLNEPATQANIDKSLDILETSGARNIRKWVGNIKVIQEVASDIVAVLISKKLRFDETFRTKFVHEFLPSACRDSITTVRRPRLQRDIINQLINNPDVIGEMLFYPFAATANMAENGYVSAVSYVKQATKQDIKDVIKKTINYLKEDASHILKDVGADSIFSVQHASRIIRGRVDKKELSTERRQELLENVEPFIYGKTPLFESLEKATKRFQEDTNSKNKLLFVLSDGYPTEVGHNHSGKINEVTSKLTKAGVTIVSCFITRSTEIHPKHLFDKMQSGWETGAKFLFSLSSEVPTQHLPRAILVKRGWAIDVTSNETKLFVQVNHPNNLREACKMAKDAVYSFDALSELLTSVDLDIYISQSTHGFEAKNQEAETCYANASAAVLHLAMRSYPDFHTLRDEMIQANGKKSADTKIVLTAICPKYRLRCREVCTKKAMKAIVKKRPE